MSLCVSASCLSGPIAAVASSAKSSGAAMKPGMLASPLLCPTNPSGLVSRSLVNFSAKTTVFLHDFVAGKPTTSGLAEGPATVKHFHETRHSAVAELGAVH